MSIRTSDFFTFSVRIVLLISLKSPLTDGPKILQVLAASNGEWQQSSVCKGYDLDPIPTDHWGDKPCLFFYKITEAVFVAELHIAWNHLVKSHACAMFEHRSSHNTNLTLLAFNFCSSPSNSSLYCPWSEESSEEYRITIPRRKLESQYSYL